MPAYWLGAFFNPRGLLALLKQDSVRNYASDRPGAFELFTFQTEFTNRDKDHVSFYLLQHSQFSVIIMCELQSMSFQCLHVIYISQFFFITANILQHVMIFFS